MFQSLLKDTLKQKGLSVRAASREIGVAHTTIFRILEGQPADLDTLVKICDWIGISPSTVLNSVAGAGSLEADIALVIQKEPRLRELFERAVVDLKREKISPADLADIIRYALYRIGGSEHEGNS